MIDKVSITVRAGDGGAGAAVFGHRKGKTFGPPMGGDGGRGGDVYLIGTTKQATLIDFQRPRQFVAEDGKTGGPNQRSGAAGNDLLIEVPKGTVVINAENGETIIDMAQTDDPVLIAKGGLGGKGNMHMRRYASHARGKIDWELWQRAQPGLEGEAVELHLELKLIADVGLVGLPNAGKSTLLSVLTAATPKIANYPFTTLEPNLGVASVGDQSFIIADIPGLIEGASEGKGLGLEFLRHIERTKVLVHLTQSPADYKAIRQELKNYNPLLVEKPEIVVLAKIDILTDDEIAASIRDFKKQKIDILPISAATHKNLDKLTVKILEKLAS